MPSYNTGFGAMTMNNRFVRNLYLFTSNPQNLRMILLMLVLSVMLASFIVTGTIVRADGVPGTGHTVP
jgi:hypothetical protein